MQETLIPAKNTARAQALVLAACGGKLDDVRRLLDSGAQTGLAKADVPFNLARNANVSAFDAFFLGRLHREGDVLNAAMYWAAAAGHGDVVDCFLARGDYCQRTLCLSLGGAVYTGNLDLVKKLVAAGANPAFEDYVVLDHSLAGARDDITTYLLESVQDGYSHALATHIRRGHFEKAEAVLAHHPDISKAVQTTAACLTDRVSTMRIEESAKFVVFFDRLMVYARGNGEDMHKHLSFAFSCAMAHSASPLLEQIFDQPEMIDHPDFKKMQDAALDKVSRAAGEKENVSHGNYAHLAQKIMRNGGNADIVLRGAIDSSDYMMAMIAVNCGGDPRRGKPSALEAAERLSSQAPDDVGKRLLFSQMQEEAEKRDAADDEKLDILTEGRFCAETLRWRDDETGMTCFMLAVLTGRAEEAVGALLKEGAKLSPDDFSCRDSKGGSLAEFLCMKGQAGLLCDLRLWQGGEKEYLDFWGALPDNVQKSEQAAHKDVREAFASAALQKNLKPKTIVAKSRWRL